MRLVNRFFSTNQATRHRYKPGDRQGPHDMARPLSSPGLSMSVAHEKLQVPTLPLTTEDQDEPARTSR
jgi:hypothetical protein